MTAYLPGRLAQSVGLILAVDHRRGVANAMLNESALSYLGPGDALRDALDPFNSRR